MFATRNDHKLREVRALLAAGEVDLDLVDLDRAGVAGEPPETGDTFVANALEKARWVHQRTGALVLADDSGLEVDALGGAPGVFSKRFSPEATAAANNALLLARLAGAVDRGGRFRCVLALVGEGGEATVDGRCEGWIAAAPRGTDGFGYDPLFVPRAHPDRTLAELSLEEKNRVSHRGIAFRRLPGLLRALSS